MPIQPTNQPRRPCVFGESCTPTVDFSPIWDQQYSVKRAVGNSEQLRIGISVSVFFFFSHLKSQFYLFSTRKDNGILSGK